MGTKRSAVRTAAAIVLAASGASSLSSPTSAQLLTYDLNGSLAPTGGSGPSLTANGGSFTAIPDGYTFGPNQGLTLDTSGLHLTRTYSVALDFSFSSLDGYRKILDFQNLSSDAGFYNLDTRLNFYPYLSGQLPAFAPDVQGTYVLTDSNGQLTGYANGVQQFTTPDTSNFADIRSALNFFIDDTATQQREASGGFVERIRIYDTALTPEEVALISSPIAVPGPVAGVGLIPLLGFAGAWFARPRKRQAA